MKALLCGFLALIFPFFSFAQSPNIISTPEGEVVSDIAPPPSPDLALPWSTDPFVKIPGNITRSVDENHSAFTLQATLLEGRKPAAIVNEKLVHIGDQVNGRTVRSIGSEFVLLEKGGSVIEVGLFEENSEENKTPVMNRAPAQASPEPLISIEELKP